MNLSWLISHILYFVKTEKSCKLKSQVLLNYKCTFFFFPEKTVIMAKEKKKKKRLIMSLSCPYKQMLAFRLCFSHSANHSYSFTDHSSASKRKFFLFLLSHCMLPTLVTSCFVRRQISTSPFLLPTPSHVEPGSFSPSSYSICSRGIFSPLEGISSSRCLLP